MSSEISIERPGRAADEGFRPWHFFVLASILLATATVIVARRSSPEHLILLSLTVGAAGLAAGAFYRMLAPLVAPLLPQAGAPVSDRTRAALDREKTLVLRSIKELEFDRAMGKLSQKDFDEMAGRLRRRALSLMKQIDAGGAGYRQVIEDELKGRLAAAVAMAPGEPEARVGNPCASCGTTNDPDAVFCKKCGTRLQA